MPRHPDMPPPDRADHARHVGAGTWAAYARCVAIRASTGRWPPLRVAAELGRAEGVDPSALLVLTHFELPRVYDRDRAFQFASLSWCRDDVALPTLEAAHALVLRGRPWNSRLVGPGRRALPTTWRGMADRVERWRAQHGDAAEDRWREQVPVLVIDLSDEEAPDDFATEGFLPQPDCR